MTEDQKKKLWKCCQKSKLGISSTEENQFCEKMFNQFPDEYEKIQKHAEDAANRQYMNLWK